MTPALDLSKIQNCSSCIVANDFTSALTLCGEFLEENKNHHYGILFLALTAYLMGDTARSITLLEQLHEITPDTQEVVDALAIIFARSGNLGEATYFAKLATVLHPDPNIHNLVPTFFRDFASALTASSDSGKRISSALAFGKGNYAECVKLCKNDIKSSPDNWAAYTLLGKALNKLHIHDEALTSLQTNLSGMHGPNSDALLEIAFSHRKLGQAKDSLLAYRIAAQCCTDLETETEILSQIIEEISSLDCDTSTLHQELLKRVEAIVLEDVDEAILISGGEDMASRKIRIAYLSDSFYDCSKGHFLERAFNKHDKSKFEIFCYQQNTQSDATTSRLKVLANDWRDVRELDDLTAAYLMTCDGIDILIDCIGVSRNQRLNVIAQKPAPIILSWLNQVDATNLAAVDAILNSESLSKGGISFDAGANLLKMDHTIRSERSEDTPLIFTTLCELENTTHDTVLAWAEILKNIPDSSLLIGGPGSTQNAIREKYTSLFMNFGLADRIFFHNSQQDDLNLGELFSMSDIHLAAFADKNINNAAAILTSGTPLIALKDNEKNKNSISTNTDLIEHCGKNEWLASTPQEYIAIVCNLASSYKTINKSDLHDEIIQMPPFQAETLSQDLEGAFVDALKGKGLL